MHSNPNIYSLHQATGRKYVNSQERKAVLECAGRAEGHVRTFVETLVYSGCRVSEALALTVGQVDLDQQVLHFETLKKRTRGHWRAVPVLPVLIEHLDLAHNIRRQQHLQRHDQLLWSFSRKTAWLHTKKIFQEAGICGPQACPKGLRHGFGVAAVEQSIPLHIIARWLGHANTNTTEIYTQVVAQEEAALAQRMFQDR